MKVPALFADVFYGLRGHINFVRTRLMAEDDSDSDPAPVSDPKSAPTGPRTI
jgi:hypothetical protein